MGGAGRLRAGVLLFHLVCILVLVCVLVSAQSPDPPADQDIVIHVVSHSHDDVGWLRTPDQYYEQEVQYILDSVFEQLLANKERKYIQVEIAFFKRWWEEQSAERRELFATLVKEKRVEFALGGWVMPDEATTYGPHVIEALTLGHEFLREAFDVVPAHGWHIDPFGASQGIAALYAAAGLGAGHVINRIDFRQKAEWAARRQLQFVWRPDPQRPEGALFAHLLDSHYCTPEGFEWEHGVNQQVMGGGAGNADGDTPIIEKAPSPYSAANAGERAAAFVAMARGRAAAYRTPHVLIPLGCDFAFQNALMKYKNMDRLIRAVNENAGTLHARAQYSTLADYFEAVRSWQPPAPTPSPPPAAPPEPAPPAPAAFPAPVEPWAPADVFPALNGGDFFPYADGPAAYWTGYFASHGALKALVRKAGAAQRAAEALFVLATWARGEAGEAPERTEADRAAGRRLLDLGRDALATAQHHDGVTGTAMAHVVLDYTARLRRGLSAAKEVAAEALARLWALQARDEPPAAFPHDTLAAALAALPPALPAPAPAPALLFGASPAPRGEARQKKRAAAAGVPIVVHNPLGWRRTAVVEARLARSDVAGVLDAAGRAVPWQLSRDPFDPTGATLRLHFLARDVEPLGYETHFAIFGGTGAVTPHEAVERKAAAVEIAGEGVRLAFDPRTGLASELRRDGLPCLALTHELLAFRSSDDRTQPSGAYIFRPRAGRPERLSAAAPRLLHMKGPLVEEVVQVYGGPVAAVQATRAYRGVREALVELEAAIPAPPPNFEVVGRVATADGGNGGGRCGGVDSRDAFETDANGLRMVKRRRNLPPVYPAPPGGAEEAAPPSGGRPGDADAGVSVAGNFYPATTRAAIRDDRTVLSLLTPRALAAASLAPGALEVMLARRLAQDDFRGVQEPLNDTEPVRVRQWLLAEAAGGASLAEERAAVLLEHPLVARFGPAVPDVRAYAERHLASLSLRGVLAAPLPPALHLLSLHAVAPQRPWAPGGPPRGWAAALRVQHLAARSSRAPPVPLDVPALLATPLLPAVAGVVEVSLTLARLACEGGVCGGAAGRADVQPGDIRAFLVTFQPPA